ncbi:MAG: hypothetical protein FJW92_01140 [Actinobacteria bacterium]|nr:hypothetical protein [Actinomycetota bacterium]
MTRDGPNQPLPTGMVGTVAAGASTTAALRYKGRDQSPQKSSAAPDAQFTLRITPEGGAAVTAPFSVYGDGGKTIRKVNQRRRTYWYTTDKAWTPTDGGFQDGCTPLAPAPITYTGPGGATTGTFAVECGTELSSATTVVISPG